METSVTTTGRKAIISNKIYLKCTETEKALITKALTYNIVNKVVTRGNKVTTRVETIRNYKVLPGGIIIIPQGRTDLIPPDCVIEDKRVSEEYPFPEPKLPLLDAQKEVYDKVNSSCFINALVGWGKTFTALYIARKLAQKTLIITHTTILRDQWIQEIKKLYDIVPGQISDSKFDIDNVLVVGNIQSVIKHKNSLYKEFGTVILDEAHHCPATTFTEVISELYAKYRIGLSGTMKRKDGKHILFGDIFGPIVHKPPPSNTLLPTVLITKPGFMLNPNLTWALRINELLYNPEYQKYVAALAADRINAGHKVLIIADRVDFLRNIKELLGEACMLVTSETPLEGRENARRYLQTGKITSIAGSRQIFSEGVSYNELSSVILASPIAGEGLLEQIVGRVMRMAENKLSCEVVDIMFSGSSDKRQNSLRLGVYLNKGWEVREHKFGLAKAT